MRVPATAATVGAAGAARRTARRTTRCPTLVAAAWRVRRRRARGEQAVDLLGREVAPAADREVAEVDVHDARALERLDLVAERGAHAPDLAVEALREREAQELGAELLDLAALREFARGQANTRGHRRDVLGRDRLVD